MTQTANATDTSNYEGMFLVSQAAANDLAGVVDHINHLFERSGATLIALSKWDERRLAFEIDRQKRGVYLLAYFTAPREAITGFERDCNLSETLMRVLVLRADHLTMEEMQATDGREDLAVEAKLRAEKAAQAVEKDESVSFGAPVDESAQANAAAETSSETASTESAAAEAVPADETPAEAAPAQAAPKEETTDA